MKKWLKIVRFLTSCLVITSSIMFILIFSIAYFNPQKEVLVTINTVGEANFELFFLAIPSVFAVIFLFFIYPRLVDGVDES